MGLGVRGVRGGTCFLHKTILGCEARAPEPKPKLYIHVSKVPKEEELDEAPDDASLTSLDPMRPSGLSPFRGAEHDALGYVVPEDEWSEVIKDGSRPPGAFIDVWATFDKILDEIDAKAPPGQPAWSLQKPKGKRKGSAGRTKEARYGWSALPATAAEPKLKALPRFDRDENLPGIMQSRFGKGKQRGQFNPHRSLFRHKGQDQLDGPLIKAYNRFFRKFGTEDTPAYLRARPLPELIVYRRPKTGVVKMEVPAKLQGISDEKQEYC